MPNIGGGGSSSISDLQFIQDKVIAGDYFQVTGAIDNLNDTIEYVPANGKTAFLLEAKIVISTHGDPLSLGGSGSADVKSTEDRVVANLKVNTVVKDTTNIGTTVGTSRGGGGVELQDSFGGSGFGNGNNGDGKFNVVGLSLEGDAAKKIEIENVLDNGSAIATMSGYLVDT